MNRIVYVLNSTYALGGASKSFLAMVGGLRKKGVCPIVVAPDREGIYADLIQMGIEVVVMTYRINTYPHLHTPRDFVLFIPRLVARRFVNGLAVKKLFAIFSGREICLVHTNVSVVDIGFRLSRKLRVPHLYHIREYGDLDFRESYYPSWNTFHKMLHAPGSYVACVTKGILFHHGLQDCGTKARVVYNGVADGIPSFPETTDGGAYFLYAGRVEPAKGLDLLLEAYALYAKETVKKTPLWVAGSMEDLTYCRALEHYLELHGLKDYVRFLGPRKDIAAVMRKAKAVVVPSRLEAFGRCMAEAMFNGCLVIGHDTGGTKEQFDNGVRQTGAEIGFRFASVTELAQALMKADVLPAYEKEEITRRAFRTVCALYTVQANVEGVYQFYSDILNENVD